MRTPKINYNGGAENARLHENRHSGKRGTKLHAGMENAGLENARTDWLLKDDQA